VPAARLLPLAYPALSASDLQSSRAYAPEPRAAAGLPEARAARGWGSRARGGTLAPMDFGATIPPIRVYGGLLGAGSGSGVEARARRRDGQRGGSPLAVLRGSCDFSPR
jgi:hypothetical protein